MRCCDREARGLQRLSARAAALSGWAASRSRDPAGRRRGSAADKKGAMLKVWATAGGRRRGGGPPSSAVFYPGRLLRIRRVSTCRARSRPAFLNRVYHVNDRNVEQNILSHWSDCRWKQLRAPWRFLRSTDPKQSRRGAADLINCIQKFEDMCFILGMSPVLVCFHLCCIKAYVNSTQLLCKTDDVIDAYWVIGSKLLNKWSVDGAKHDPPPSLLFNWFLILQHLLNYS